MNDSELEKVLLRRADAIKSHVIECEHGVVLDWGDEKPGDGWRGSGPAVCHDCAGDIAEWLAAQIPPPSMPEQGGETDDPAEMLAFMAAVVDVIDFDMRHVSRSDFTEAQRAAFDKTRSILLEVHDTMASIVDALGLCRCCVVDGYCVEHENHGRVAGGKAPYHPADAARAARYGLPVAELQRILNRAAGRVRDLQDTDGPPERRTNRPQPRHR